MISIVPESTSLVIDPTISLDNYMTLDLSVSNPEIMSVQANSSSEWEQYINDFLHRNNKKIAFGGYLEKRNIYQRSDYFKNSESNRNIHLGIDFWIAAGTGVHAFADGVVHSFQDNQNHGDYGPTIILEHGNFYSLYGHLSRESLLDLSVGDTVNCGQKIAELGDASINGDYAPHLHFQLILDLEGNSGDYPGVCTEEEIPRFQENCPNPLPLLGL